MASGLLRLVTVSGAHPVWVVEVDSSAGISIDDHLATPIEPSGGGLFRVSAVISAIALELTDDIDVDPHKPRAGNAQFYTPTAGFDLSQCANSGPHWGAALRRDMKVIDDSLSGSAGDFVEKAGDTMTGPLVLPASTLADAGLSIPHGDVPATPNDGDVWTTSAGMFVRVDGLSIGPLGPGAIGDFVEKAGDVMTGQLGLPASTSTEASLNVPHGAAPTSPSDGDVWTTAAGFFVHVNGVTLGPLVSGTFVSKTGDTMTGKLVLPASGVGGAGLQTPQGAAPAAPQDGDIWVTATGVYARVSGVTVGPFVGPTSVLQNHPFTEEVDVVIDHGLGRYPVIQLIEKVVGGLWGSGGFGQNGYGTSEIRQPIPVQHYKIQFTTVDQVRIIFDNYRDGEVIYG